MNKRKVLIADDEERIRDLVSDFLVADGFEVITAKDGKEAIDTFVSVEDIDLVILDVMMPNMDGYEALKEIKKISDVPVILLTAKTGEYDELKGLGIGGDDFIKKPFRPKILVARCNALLRRNKKDEKAALTINGITLNIDTRQALVDEEEVELTAKEFELLHYFMINKNVALSRDKLLENLWGYDYEGDDRTVDTHVKKLRSKLKNKGKCIKTVWSFGYKFEDNNS